VLSAVALAILSTPGPPPLLPPSRVAAQEVAAQIPQGPPILSVRDERRYGEPVRLMVPALGIDRELIRLGLTPDHRLEVPVSRLDAGWYIHSSVPGEAGPAIVAGHVSSEAGPGIFYALHLLEPGDDVIIEGEGGTVAHFRIERVQRYPKADFPTKAVYGRTKYAGIRLITCGGAFNPDTGHFLDNVIAFGRLVFQRPSEGPVNSEGNRTFFGLD
jgi:hypothetical protein